MKPNALVTRFAIAAIAFAGLVPLARATTVFQISDAVTSGEGQNVFASAEGKTFTATPSSLVYNNDTGSTYFVVKFPEAVSLTDVGDKLTLSYSVAITNSANSGGQAFRLGVYDVGSATGSAFGTSTGYRADYGTSTNNRGFYERTGNHAGLFNAHTQFDPTTYDYSRGSFSRTLNETGTVSFTGTFSIELLAGDKVQISTQIGPNAVATMIDAASAYTTFNAVAFWATASSSGGNTLAFSDLTVSLTSIPEPASAAAWLSGILGVAAVMVRRRRHA